ncbi:MAG: PHP domain-containing protein [Candidatus Kariarchaeaceae archaeon]|jgi:predicted metal-dependent phosphoesterase TrpH
MNIDLHCHSTNSDGTWSVEQILIEAEKKGIIGLSITDHDNFQGSLEAFQLKDKMFSGLLVPGIEISTRINSKTFHLLAYFPSFDLDLNDILFKNLEKIRDSRIWRMKEMIKKANHHGFEVSFDEVLKEAGTGLDGTQQPTDVLSRPHLARVLLNKGYVENFGQAFDKYLADGKPIHVYRFTLDVGEWVQQVKNLGGILIWAHPFHGHDEELESFNSIVKIMDEANIDGVESIYNYHGKYNVSQEFIQKCTPILQDYIRKKKWIITAGGDFHGNVGKLGVLDLPENDWEVFLQKLGL